MADADETAGRWQDGRAERWDAWIDAVLVADGATRPVLIANLSLTGCLATLDHGHAVGDGAVVDLLGVGRRDIVVVRRILEFAGCRFAVPLTAAELARLRPCEMPDLPLAELPGAHLFARDDTLAGRGDAGFRD